MTFSSSPLKPIPFNLIRELISHNDFEFVQEKLFKLSNDYTYSEYGMDLLARPSDGVSSYSYLDIRFHKPYKISFIISFRFTDVFHPKTTSAWWVDYVKDRGEDSLLPEVFDKFTSDQKRIYLNNLDVFSQGS